MDDIAIELMRIRHSVISMRETILADLNNLEAQINALLPRRDPPTPIKYDLNTIREWAYGDKAKKHNKKGKILKKGKALNK